MKKVMRGHSSWSRSSQSTGSSEGREVGVTDGELNNDLMKNAEKKEQLAKSYRSGSKDERRPAGPTLEAVSVFKRDIEKIMASEEAGEMRSKEVAEKVWQANQSGCKKAQTLAAHTAGAKKLCVGQRL